MASSSLVLFVALLSTVYLANGFVAPSLRILGGNEVTTDDFPYMASVRRANAHVCGGSIVSKRYILTAAHCVSSSGINAVDPKTVTVRVGSKNIYAGGKVLQVEEIFIHKSYGSFLNDMALLKLPSDLELTSKVQIIGLADKPEEVTAGNSVVFGGWGRTEVDGKISFKLHHGEGSVISASECENEIGYGHEMVLCVKNKLGSGSCNGDAGGPAVHNNKLVGVSNFVIGSCGTKYPDVYAKVSHFHSWIINIINS